ncbi:response regulator transcription factor [Microbacterium sp. LRZ72]|uniref:response regulator transcription factor n=1 Tax=Microbacterium sp. LRZ72 TaxID=2942481 RepID=UPI0029ACD424|nr:response regulator transcription factor [Microbacterium sp. LRZ72]MDX2377996.1 response regulator transcription factor [Microbacterium sp. LRZ72]
MPDTATRETAVIVEDDPDVRHLLAEVLEAAGFSTVSVGNGIDGIRAVTSYQPLITTLDVNMPGIDGIEAARRIRAQSDTYIIMISGLEDEADVLMGLGAGADDYITKPFRPREFRARIDAMLRRPRATGTSQSQPRQQERFGPSFPGARPAAHGWVASPQPGFAPPPQPYPGTPAYMLTPAPSEHGAYAPAMVATPVDPSLMTAGPGTAQTADAGSPGATQPTSAQGTDPGSEVQHAEEPQNVWMAHRDLRVNPDTRIVMLRDGEVELTRTEFELLATLMESKRRVRSKADLTLVLRGESYVTSYFVGEADKRAVEAHMTNLRRKLGDSPTTPRYIETVRGVGYRLTAETETPAA